METCGTTEDGVRVLGLRPAGKTLGSQSQQHCYMFYSIIYERYSYAGHLILTYGQSPINQRYVWNVASSRAVGS